MKKIYALILSFTANACISMEQETTSIQAISSSYMLTRSNTGIFARIPHDVMKEYIMPHFAKLKRPATEHARTFHALCKSNKYFAQFLCERDLNGTLIQTMAKKENEDKGLQIKFKEISSDSTFAAVRLLNTSGAKTWMREVYRNVPNLGVHHELGTLYRAYTILLQYGSNPNSPISSADESPLQQAAAINNLKCVKILLQYQANPNYFSNINIAFLDNTHIHLPLRIALENKCTHRIIIQLLMHGADPMLVDGSGISPLDYARQNQEQLEVKPSVLQFMEEYANKLHPPQRD